MIFVETVRLDATNSILLEVLDARTVKMTIKSQGYNIVYDGNRNIHSIHIAGRPYIDIYDLNKIFIKIEGNVIVYPINFIECVKDNVFLLHTVKRTKTSYFITPTVFTKKEDIRWDQYFVNAFILDEDEFPRLGILLRFFPTKNYIEFEALLKKHKAFFKTIETDYGHTMFVFNFNEEFYEDIDKFLKGRYSEFSPNMKRRIMSFNNAQQNGKIYQILNKSSTLRRQLELNLGVLLSSDIELYDIPDKTKEIYRYKYLVGAD